MSRAVRDSMTNTVAWLVLSLMNLSGTSGSVEVELKACHVTFIPENRARDGAYTASLQALGVEALYHPYLPSVEHHLKKEGSRYDAVIVRRVEVAGQFVETVRRFCPRATLIFDTVDLHVVLESRRARRPAIVR